MIKTEFKLEKLNKNNLLFAVKLSDECVGKNLYTNEYLSSVIDKPNHYFYFLTSDLGEYVGYIYFFKIDSKGASKISKISESEILRAIGGSDSSIWNLQSIAVSKAFRGYGLSNELVSLYLNKISEFKGHNTAFGVFWKPQGKIPMEKTLNKFGFKYLRDAHKVWYDNENLVCPYCKGRCVCDAAVYYKKLKEENE